MKLYHVTKPLHYHMCIYTNTYKEQLLFKYYNLFPKLDPPVSGEVGCQTGARIRSFHPAHEAVNS